MVSPNEKESSEPNDPVSNDHQEQPNNDVTSGGQSSNLTENTQDNDLIKNMNLSDNKEEENSEIPPSTPVFTDINDDTNEKDSLSSIPVVNNDSIVRNEQSGLEDQRDGCKSPDCIKYDDAVTKDEASGKDSTAIPEVGEEAAEEEEEVNNLENKPINALLEENELNYIANINVESESIANSEHSSYYLTQSDDSSRITLDTHEDELFLSNSSDFYSESSYSEDESQQVVEVVDVVDKDLPVTLRLLISYCNQLVNSISGSDDSNPNPNPIPNFNPNPNPIPIPNFDFNGIHKSLLLTQSCLAIEDSYISSVASELRSIQGIVTYFSAQFNAIKEMDYRRLQKYISKRDSIYYIRILRSLKKKIDLFEWRLNYLGNYMNAYKKRKAQGILDKIDNRSLDETLKLAEYS